MREIALTENDLVMEFTTAQGGFLNINGVKIPPLTIGKISLLASINSPFLEEKENNSFSGKDILDALYICTYGFTAIQEIYQASRQIKQLEMTQLATCGNSENYQIMVDKIEKHTEAYKNFDEAVLIFADDLGFFNIQETAEWLVEQISVGLNGYNMIVSENGNKKKVKGQKQLMCLTNTGLLKQLPWFPRLLIWILKKLSGKYRLQK